MVTLNLAILVIYITVYLVDSGGYDAGSNVTEAAVANIHITHHTVSYRVHY